MEELGTPDLKAQHVCQLPISSAANDANEDGIPLSLARPAAATSELEALSQLAQIVSKELFELPYRPETSSGMVSFDDNNGSFELASIQLSLDGDAFLLRAFSEEGALQQRFLPKELRGRDPKTGAVQEIAEPDEDSLPKKSGMVEIHRAGATKGSGKDVPGKVEKKGRVGYEVVWGDGAKYIYSRRSIALAAGGKIHNQ